MRELRRVLRHLLDNGIRHSPDGGTVTVELVQTTDAAELVVRDEGPGFDPAFVDRAFDRFSRADAARTRASGGAGLGLAIARELVEAQDGEIGARPGPGGVVCVRLPTPD